MERQKKLLQKIRKAETEIAVASPPRAAKLAAKIVKWKHHVFDER